MPVELGNLQARSILLNGNELVGSLDAAFCPKSPAQELIVDCLEDELECSCCTTCCTRDDINCTTTTESGPIGSTLAPEIANSRILKLRAILEPISGTKSLSDPTSDHYKVLQWMAQSDPNPQDIDNTDPIYIVQKYVLILLFVSLNGNNWKDNIGWLGETSFCSWDGISCDSGDLVEAIDLGGRYCVGGLATEIGALNTTIKILNLGNNPELSGTVPTELAALTALASLDLSYCQFTGSLPLEISRLSHLEELHVDNNLLVGSISPEIASLSRLKRLSMGHNDFTGTIPSELGDMEELIVLEFNDNSFTSTIPTQLGSLGNLNSLDLSYNELIGAIPFELGGMTLLENLYLSKFVVRAIFIQKLLA